MAEKYYSILTNRGKELEAQSSVTGQPVTIKDFVIGDGNGEAVTPDPARTALIREVYRGSISALNVSPEQSNQWMANIVLPSDIGGFTVREVGLLTDAGELYAVANCAAIEKPESGVSVSLQFRLAVNETASIELKVVSGDGLFLRIDQNLKEIKESGVAAQKESRESIGVFEGSKLQKGIVQLDSATDSTSEELAATPAAVKIAMDNASARMAKERNGADIPNVGLFIQNLGLTETVKLAAEALSKKGGEVNGDLIIKGILSILGNELVIEKDNGFSGLHIKNKSYEPGAACGADFSFGGAIMASLICGIMSNGANYIDVALSPPGAISDRRLNAFTLNGDVKQFIFQNGWSLQGYTKGTDFTQLMADSGWCRFPNGLILQWCWGNTDGNGWAGIPFPIGWPIRCFGAIPINVASDVPASAISGVKRLNDRDMQVTLLERTGTPISKPFFCVGLGV